MSRRPGPRPPMPPPPPPGYIRGRGRGRGRGFLRPRYDVSCMKYRKLLLCVWLQDNGAVDDGGPRYPTRSFRRGYGGVRGRVSSHQHYSML